MSDTKELQAENAKLKAALGLIRSTVNFGVNNPDEALDEIDNLARAALTGSTTPRESDNG